MMSPPIHNHQDYCRKMTGSMQQKLFFLDHITPFSLLDFGCADGTLLKEVQKNVLSIGLCGYDHDPKMVENARKNLQGEWIFIDGNWEDALAQLRINTDNSIAYGDPTSSILFSSVLHEVYSQESIPQVNEMWQQVAATGVEYIIVRDMYWGEQKDSALNTATVATLLEYQFPELTSQFHDSLICGESLDSGKFNTEFLLKYPYKENWERELQEDYFALPDLRPVLLSLGYESIHWSHHQVPYIQKRILKDTGITNPFNTHLTAIFQKV